MTNYKLIYDIKKDMWNWRGGTKQVFLGDDFTSNARFIEDDEGREIADKIKDLNKPEAEEILKPYLIRRKNDKNSRLNQFIKLADDEFQQKFIPACEALERITKRPMMADEFIFYITSFPRMPYFYEKQEIYVFDCTAEFWGMPIDGVLHELLHFQFEHYWLQDKQSGVSRLSDDEYIYLKEALTVVLDGDLKPIITVPDEGLQSQRELSRALHKEWVKHYDFDKLVEFGLSVLSKYISLRR